MKKAIDFLAKNPVLITALVCFIFYFLPFKPKPFGDGDYHYGTIQLIEFIKNGFTGDFAINKGILTLVCYLIPYVLVFPFKGDNLYLISGIIFNCLFACLSVYYLFKAFYILQFTNKTKALILILICLFPIHIYYSMGIIGEIFCFFATSVLVYYWVKINYTSTKKNRDFFYLTLAMVLLYGAKPIALPFVIAFVVYILISKFELKNKIIVLITISIIPLLMVIEMNFDKTNNEFKKMVFRNQILWSRYELRDEPFNWVPQHGTKKTASIDYLNNLKKRVELDSICEANNYNKTDYYVKWVKNDILDHPILTIRQCFLKFFQSQSFIITPLIKSNKPIWLKFIIHLYINVINYVLLIFGMLGFLKLARLKKWKLFIPILLYWGSSLCYVFLLHSEQRYLFGFRPMLLFLCAYYINYLFSKKNKSQTL